MWIRLTIYCFLIVLTFPNYGQTDKDIQLANEYYSKGELVKAREIYDDLIKNIRTIPLIHNNYFDLLIDLEQYNDAEKYINKITKAYPDNIDYKLDIGYLILKRGREEAADKYFNEFIDYYNKDVYKLRLAAQYFVRNQLTGYAVQAFIEGRKASDNPVLFSLELANLYRLLNKKDLMVKEYLNYATHNPSNVSFIKNTLQNLISTPEELEKLEYTLLEKVQKEPGNKIYSELLIWVNLQQKNFYGAYVQARAMDRREQNRGSRTLQIGLMALRNSDYKSAARIFQYIVDNYPGTENYKRAKLYLIEARELKVKNSYPVDNSEIRGIIADYEDYINQFRFDPGSSEALRNQALLYAFYLDERDSAIHILQRILNMPRISSHLKAQCKIDLGDIFILDEQPWEATLLYSQVEKTMKETPLGYEAKLKNAKLSYYKGDFDLAQEHLDILKMATTREIANDAMSLSILIQDNTGMDTSEVAMQEYAKIDLMLYQNKTDEALNKIDDMLDRYLGHSLRDELLWLKAEILLKLGEFQNSITTLESIVDQYNYDVLSDDAYFMIGKVHEEQLGNHDIAMKIYEDFLTKYPGSIYVAEARKRFRSLRGDFNYTEAIN